MTACIFLGPTLPLDQARAVLDAIYLPPVRQGDVYRVLHHYRPCMIGIVDGYFHQVPSVWHKEILAAMAEGVHVFGSASMGALRAAELQDFGMQGVGDVFQDFRDGVLEDDDEVAVVHAPAEIGFAAASEAMVNIRRTLDAAKVEEVLSAATHRDLIRIAKSLFYPERSFTEMLKRGAAEGLPRTELDGLNAWLETGRVDVKRSDALAMLHLMKDRLDSDPEPMAVDYSVEHTTMWDIAARGMVAEPAASEIDGDADVSAEMALMDEIRLDPRYDEIRRAGLLRLLTLDTAERIGVDIDDDQRREAVSTFRLDRDLHLGADLRAWLESRDLDRRGFEALLEDDLTVEEVSDRLLPQAAGFIIDELRLRGDYDRLAARARVKQCASATVQKDRELTEDRQAITWYFTHRMDAPPPDDLDAFARKRGFKDGDDFRRAVRKDYRHRSISDGAAIDEGNSPPA